MPVETVLMIGDDVLVAARSSERMQIELADGAEWTATGDIIEKNYVIESEHGVVARTSRKWFRIRDSYGIDIDHPDLPLVIGMGSRLFSPSHVIAVDLADSRLEAAKQFGADITVNNSRQDPLQPTTPPTPAPGPTRHRPPTTPLTTTHVPENGLAEGQPGRARPGSADRQAEMA
jgi:hypothetical protein